MDRSFASSLLLVFAACFWLTGCGSSFPHDTQRLMMVHEDNATGAALREPIVLMPGDGGEVVTWEGPVLTSTLGCKQLIASWNVDVPDGTGVWFEARIRQDQSVSWSRWLLLGEAGESLSTDVARVAHAGLRVDVDVLTSKTWFRDSQIRVRAAKKEFSGEKRVSEPRVVVHRLDVTRTLAFPRFGNWLRREARHKTPGWEELGIPPRIEHPVAFLSQATSRPELSGRLCSPTSVAMAVSWANGETASVEEIANLARDAVHDLYGNWPRNVQAAWKKGVPGRVTRFGAMADVYRLLASGAVIVASIKVEPGELRGAPYEETDGHLILIRGYTEVGDLLVNDPAASTTEAGQLIYNRHDMISVWLGRGRGTAYVFVPRGKEAVLDMPPFRVDGDADR